MTLFKKTYDSIIENRENILKGNLNCIPLPFKRLANILPGFIKGTNWIISAASGTGKSQITKYLIYETFIYCIEKQIDCQFLYFALEESDEELMISFICLHLYKKYNVEVDPLQLQSMFEDKSKVVNDYILKLIEKESEFFNKFNEHFHVFENIANPTGILKTVKDFAIKRGKFTYEKRNIDDKEVEILKSYQSNDQNEYVFVVCDHISLLEPESNKFKQADTLHSAMSLFSANYARRIIAKIYKYIPILVQQQAAVSEEKQFNNQGELVINKLIPSLNTLADNKMTARDALFVLALFAPDRYDIPMYRGYNIQKLKDNYRSLFLLKNRKGRSNIEVPLLFKGNVNYFKELPYPHQLSENFYKHF